MIQDTRGRGDSDGVFTPWLDDFDDGYDTVEWVAAQDWCNGKVGMLGGSYMAWVQWTAAARKPPHLVTLVTAGSQDGGSGTGPTASAPSGRKTTLSGSIASRSLLSIANPD